MSEPLSEMGLWASSDKGPVAWSDFTDTFADVQPELLARVDFPFPVTTNEGDVVVFTTEYVFGDGVLVDARVIDVQVLPQDDEEDDEA